jgi:4-coumarate--CoA ligase
MGQVRERTSALGNALVHDYEIKRDDVVVIFSPNHIDYPIAIWAVHQTGAIVSGANPSYTANELQYQLEATQAKLIISDPASLTTTLEAAKAVGLSKDRIILFDTKAADSSYTSVSKLVERGTQLAGKGQDFTELKLNAGESKTKLAFLSFSSGTTGKPKAVAIAHYSVIINVVQCAVHNKVNENYTNWDDRRYRPGDVAMAVLPLYHIYGLVVNLHFTIYAGLSIVIVPKFEFVSFLKSIVRYNISHLFIVPPQAVLLCKHPAVKDYDIKKHIRMIMTGAAPLSEEVNYQLFKLLPNAHIGQAYGMTETCTATTMWPLKSKRGTSGSSGHIMPGIMGKVVKPDGTLAKHGEEGEFYLHSPSNAICYANNRQATEETFIDGWVRTGDSVIIREDNEVFIVDRLKEIMKVRGFQVAPAELEGCLLDHPDVSDVCVVGIPDEFSGELPLAFIVPTVSAEKAIAANPGHAKVLKESIAKHVARNKINYKHLKGGVEFIDVIPKNPSGKLLRRVLRDKAKDIAAARKASGSVKL